MSFDSLDLFSDVAFLTIIFVCFLLLYSESELSLLLKQLVYDQNALCGVIDFPIIPATEFSNPQQQLQQYKTTQQQQQDTKQETNTHQNGQQMEL